MQILWLTAFFDTFFAFAFFFFSHWMAGAFFFVILQFKSQAKSMDAIKKLVENITEGIQEKKGKGIVIADMTGVEGAICRYFVICEGNSPTQVEAIADAVEETARVKSGEKPVKVVGLIRALWVAMDYTDVIVHIFVPEMRQFYNLEALWEDAPLTQIPDLE